MPRKGGGGQSPPDGEDRIVHTPGKGPLPGTLDRSTEAEKDKQSFVYGDIVHDEEQTDPDDLVVVNLPGVSADRWPVDGGTLADQNPACPTQDDVIVMVLLLELVEYMPDWKERTEEIALDQLRDDSVTLFVHPGMRLDLVEPSHLRA